MTSTAEVIAALEKGLAAYARNAGPYARENDTVIVTAIELRTLLDAHASAIEANAELLDQMHHFANADQRLWDEGQRDPESFKSWVRSRAAHLLAKFNRPALL